jgi:hypothetical protein
MKGKLAKAPTGKPEELEDADNDDSGEKKQ